jgi:hypothetical protein
MGFLQRFFKNVFHENVTIDQVRSSFQHLSENELEAHLDIDHYGGFQLTEAIRPSFDLQIVPRQGYRHDVYRDEEAKTSVPVLMCAATSDVLFGLFMELIDPLGFEVDVVLETSHDRNGGHEDLYREHIDMPVFKSTLWDYEDLLLNDGCTGIAVLNPDVPQEVQFDEHKLLIVYGDPLDRFEQILIEHGVYRDDEINFISEAEHVHSSSETYSQQFRELQTNLGMDGYR